MADHKIANYSLWQEYAENGSKQIREKIILEYLPLVKYQAGRVKMLVPMFIDLDDLESYGVIGLIDAVNKFKYQKGIEFSTYASRRIRGEIIDHLRKLDWLPHSMRRDGKKIKKAVEEFSRTHDRKPTVDELAEKCDISRKRIKKVYRMMSSSQWVSLYDEIGENRVIDFIEDSKKTLPETRYNEQEKEKLLIEAIDSLKEQEKKVIALFYYEDLTQKEIAEIMGVSAARISQIHKKAVYRLRGMLGRKKALLI